jgi:PAS domain S-box-containing protein
MTADSQTEPSRASSLKKETERPEGVPALRNLPSQIPVYRRSSASLPRLSLALYAAEVGIWEWNVTENSMSWSLGVDKIFGLSRRPADQSMTELFHQILPEDLEKARSFFEKVVSNPSTRALEFHCRIRRRDGQIRWIEVVGSVGEGSSLLLLGTVRDVTDRFKSWGDTGFFETLLDHQSKGSSEGIRTESELLHTQRLESLGTAVSGIAHELRNILTPIILHTQAMQEDLGPAHAAQRGLKEVMTSCGRAKELIQQILTFGRREEARREAVDLREVVGEAAGLLRATIPESVALNVDLPSNLPRVLVDATQIHQVVLNLGINAWHALESRPGNIGIALAEIHANEESAGFLGDLPPGRYVRLSVRDNGKGMEASVVNRIFEPFFTTKPPGKGTGLGLAMVHGIVKNHGGFVSVDSKPGQGALFEIYFPELVSGCNSSTASETKTS